MMRRTELKRTAWQRKSPPGYAHARESRTNQPLALVECAATAIKKIVKSTAVMARISRVGPATAIPGQWPKNLPKFSEPFNNRSQP